MKLRGRPPKQPLPDGSYVCSHCTQPKPADGYYASQGRGWCKDCMNGYRREHNTGYKRALRGRKVYQRIIREIRMEQESSGVLMLQAWATS